MYRTAMQHYHLKPCQKRHTWLPKGQRIGTCSSYVNALLRFYESFLPRKHNGLTGLALGYHLCLLARHSMSRGSLPWHISLCGIKLRAWHKSEYPIKMEHLIQTENFTSLGLDWSSFPITGSRASTSPVVAKIIIIKTTKVFWQYQHAYFFGKRE